MDLEKLVNEFKQEQDATKRAAALYRAIDVLSQLHAETVGDAVRAAKRDYARAWRKKNPGKVKEYANRYWAKRARHE